MTATAGPALDARHSGDPRDGEPPARALRVAQVVTKLSAGAGGITLRGSLALDPTRYETTIFAGEGSSLIDRAEEAGVPVVPLRHMAPQRRIYPWEDARGLDELAAHLVAGGFDVVHTHSAKAGGLGRLAAQRVGVPGVVHSFHGFPFHSFQSPLRRRALVAIERRLARITDYFLTDGTMVAAEAVRLRIAAPDRIRATASPVDDDIPVVSERARDEARRLLGIPAGIRVVGTVARLDHQKAPLVMVKAIAALQRPEVVALWVGDGELRGVTERLVEREGLRGRFVLLGDRSDVSSLLPAFDVFAMPSLYEGLSCAVVEAMTCGVPVVATAVNSMPEVVVAGKTGLLARPGDPESLACALAWQLDHPDDAARMADAGRVHVGERFRARALARDLAAAYDLALVHGARRARASSARFA